jgi:two-component system, OmpR family, sensor histidine kinase TctE
MSSLPKKPVSIRRRLLVFLIGAACLMVAAAAVVTYFVALKSANNAYDRSLLDPALDIADNVRLDVIGAHIDLPQKALEALVYDQVDKVIFQVRSPSNIISDGVDDLPSPPEILAGKHAFFDAVYHGENIRIAALRSGGGFVVQVGETLHKRNRLVWEILVSVLVSTIGIALGSIALAWFGVTRSLQPLEKLRTELLRRVPIDLRPLEEVGSPVEIYPLLNAFNGLLRHLRDANSMQQRFLADAAHQLRTPLAGLQMHLELLARRELPSDVRVELDRMHGATVRASRLAKQLLALAKAEGVPDESREHEILDLRTLASAAAQDWALRAFNEKIDLGFNLQQAIVLGDPLLLPELLDNLIDNALRYTPVNGQVTVTTGYENDVPFLNVTDTGPGIPLAERTKVLERFYRIAGTSGDGSGLGLAIVREVVERHGARLHIDGSGEHGGTDIRIDFPKLEPTEQPAPKAPRSGSDPRRVVNA